MNLLWITNCNAYSDPMTSDALDRLAGSRRTLLCSSERRAEVVAATLKIWRHIKNSIPSIDVYLLEEQSCQMSSWSDSKRRSIRLFWRETPQQEKEQEEDEEVDEEEEKEKDNVYGPDIMIHCRGTACVHRSQQDELRYGSFCSWSKT